jgi:hypothetical protein
MSRRDRHRTTAQWSACAGSVRRCRRCSTSRTASATSAVMPKVRKRLGGRRLAERVDRDHRAIAASDTSTSRRVTPASIATRGSRRGQHRARVGQRPGGRTRWCEGIDTTRAAMPLAASSSRARPAPARQLRAGGDEHDGLPTPAIGAGT